VDAGVLGSRFDYPGAIGYGNGTGGDCNATGTAVLSRAISRAMT